MERKICQNDNDAYSTEGCHTVEKETIGTTLPHMINLVWHNTVKNLGSPEMSRRVLIL